MSTLTLRTAAHKAALVDAIGVMSDLVHDELYAVYSPYYNYGLKTQLRQKEAFILAFSAALTSVPVGISVFLEGLEVEVVRDGLQVLLDNAEEDEVDLEYVLSPANIKSTILASQTSWGSIDVERLSKSLSEQALPVDSTSAIEDLLAQLS